jgi:hypothetical protein
VATTADTLQAVPPLKAEAARQSRVNRGQKVFRFFPGYSGANVDIVVDTRRNPEGHEVMKPFSP